MYDQKICNKPKRIGVTNPDWYVVNRVEMIVSVLSIQMYNKKKILVGIHKFIYTGKGKTTSLKIFFL